MTCSIFIPLLLELYGGKNVEPQTISTQQPKVVPTLSMPSPSDAAGLDIPLPITCSSGTLTSTRNTVVASCTTNPTDDTQQSITNYSEVSNMPPIPNIPPPPIPLHPSQYPPPPPLWELPRVPSANATLSHGSQNMPDITESSFHQYPSQLNFTFQQDQLNTGGALSALTSHPPTGPPAYGPLPMSRYPLSKPCPDHIVPNQHQLHVPNKQNIEATTIQPSATDYYQRGNNLHVSKNDSLFWERL